MVSIIMPISRPPAAFLHEAVESVLQQSYGDWELWMVDDCPDEPHEAIVRAYSDDRIHYLANDRGLDVAAGRNRGVAACGGEYVAFLEPGDVWMPEKLERQCAQLIREPDAVMVYSPLWFGENRQEWPQTPHGGDRFADLLRHCNILSCSAILCRRMIFTEWRLAFASEASPCDDYDLYLRMVRWGRIVRGNEVLVRCRKLADHASDDLYRIQRTKLRIVQRQLDCLCHEGCGMLWDRWHCRRALGRLYGACAAAESAAGDDETAEGSFWYAWWFNPLKINMLWHWLRIFLLGDR